MPACDLTPEWEGALARAAAARRVAVLGPTDAGKSTFLHALAERRPGLALIDLDPGQKMIGPPGTASLGQIEPDRTLARFIFLGSTAVGSFRALAEAAADLAASAPERFAVNTSGYVAGPGARMQAMTLGVLKPELVVAIGAGPALEPVLAPYEALRLERSPFATHKPPARRRTVRQAAFADALAGAKAFALPDVRFEPAAPKVFEGSERPVCTLADAGGEDMALAVLLSPDTVLARVPGRPVRTVRLGKMWAAPGEEGSRLLERLAPAWDEGG